MPTSPEVARGTLRGRMIAVVAVLVTLLIAVATSTGLARIRVQDADNRVDRVLVPAQRAVAGLGNAYVDIESGERGYMLTGDTAFLQPYNSGLRTAAALHRQLRTQLRGDPVALGRLTEVAAAAQAWVQQGAAPGIAERAGGRTPSRQQLRADSLEEKRLFDGLRQRLAQLSSHVNALVTAELGRARDAQNTANWAAFAAVLVAVVVAMATAVVLRRSLSRPLGRLVRQVQTVADGDLDQPVEASGPSDIAAVASAVDRMRRRILADTEAAAEIREQLAMHSEGDRIARDLHDIVIQRLFAAGMRLESVSARHPELADTLRDVVDEVDRSIRELRTVIFGLTAHQVTGGVRERVLTLVRDSERSLGFAPSLHFEGPVDVLTDEAVVNAVVPSLGEMLSNVARHAQARVAEVRLEASKDTLRLVVSDDGVGFRPAGGGRGLGNLSQRAQALGGSCVVSAGPNGGTVVEWSVPLAPNGDSGAVESGITDEAPVSLERQR